MTKPNFRAAFFRSLLPLLAAWAVSAGAAPRIQHWTTDTGARVYFVETHALPMVDVQVDFAAGSAYEPAGKNGLAGLTHGLLERGAGDYDETTLAGKFADLGAQTSGSIDQDRAGWSLRTLSAPDKLQPALALLQQVLGAPRFEAAVFERERSRTLAGLRESFTQPSALLERGFWAYAYQGHPYGQLMRLPTLEVMQREDVVNFWRQHYNAPRAAITLVGDLDRAAAEALAARLAAALPVASGEAPGAAADVHLPVPTVHPAQEIRIPHPAAQAHITLGMPALQRGDADVMPLLVGNYILGGGGFSSRLMNEVREKRGYVYGISSHFAAMRSLGPFQISFQTKRNQADAALQVVRQTLADFLAQGPTEAEVKAAKANLIGSFPLNLDSNHKLLAYVAVIGFYGMPLDWLDTYQARLARVTAAEVKVAFARHVQLDKLLTVRVASD